jgi:signal transduction histidine kinase/CheY-like chemotaxis protein
MTRVFTALKERVGGIRPEADADTPAMNIHPLTLRFNGELEHRFREAYYKSSIGLLRISFILGIVYYSLFAVLDVLVMPGVDWQLAVIRFLFVCPLLLVIFSLSFTRGFRQWWQLGASVATVVAGLGIVVMTVITPQVGRVNYYPGIMLVLFYCYMLLRLRFIWAMLSGWLIFIAYVALTVIFPGVESSVLLINFFFICSANLLGMFGGYTLEYYNRRDFYSRHLLDRERRKVARVNATLEERVVEKTKQLEQSQKMETFGKLAGGISHDFNNLLTIINGNTDVVLFELEQGDAFYEELTEIKEAGRRAVDLTRQLLAFSRKQVFMPRVVDLQDLLLKMRKILSRLIGEDYSLVVDKADELQPALADAGQLEQVIMNLVINARDASPSGSEIRISARNRHLDEDLRDQDDVRERHEDAREGDYVVLAVEDDGEGIPAKQLEQIFEPFFTTKAEGAGTGLGLSVVYGIIEQHGGWINVHSEPGRGTTFQINLPATALEPGNDSGQETGQRYLGSGERILFVEDEKGVRTLGVRVLRDHGYDVVAAPDASCARDIFDEAHGRFDIVVSDVVLPDRSGVLLVKELQERQPGLKVLLASGYTAHRSNLDRIHDEAIPFIQKPYPIADLLRTIQSLLRER